MDFGVDAVDQIFERAIGKLGGEDEADRERDQSRPHPAGPKRRGHRRRGEAEQALDAETLLAAEDDADSGQREAQPGAEGLRLHLCSSRTTAPPFITSRIA